MDYLGIQGRNGSDHVGEPNMEAQTTQDERHDVARRLFAALCKQYPDRYIAPIEQPEVAVSPAERRTDTREGCASFEAITGRP
jgi:hypothetical protein